MKKMRKQNRSYITAFLVMLCFLFLFALPAKADTVEHKTVRVGYYPVANYQEVNADGTYAGFSYDYYIQIQKYTRWNYEFVEATYADCLKMLQNGEIDIMCGMGKTAAREEQMIFSHYSVSNSQNKLYARNDNNKLFYESYDTFDGCKIAMMKGMLADEVEWYSAEHNFKAEIVNYDTMSEMEEALLSNEVDMVCASSITNEIDTKIVGRMDKQPLYYVTSKQETEIASELDDALRKIVDNNPNFYTQMSEKYMISGANATATFTREELAYIKSGQKIYFILNADWAPITWYDKERGEFRGIFVDVIQKIEEYSGIEAILCTEEEFDEMAEKDPSMIENVVAILADDNSWALQQNVMMSNHVVDSPVVMVTKRGVRQTEMTEQTKIAIPNRFYISYVMKEELEEELEGKQVVYYDTVRACLDAVNSGRADATYVNELVSTYYLSMLEYSELFATANSRFYENLGFAVNKDSDAPLLSILDKSLLCLGSTDIEQIVIQNSIAEQRSSLKGLYYSNPVAVITGVIIFLTLCFVTAFFTYHSMEKKKQTELELQKEFETGRARTEFFMMISHELRTPLNAIVGYLQLALEMKESDILKTEYVKRSLGAAKQLTVIAQDMLDYTKIAADTAELHEELFDMKDVIMNADQNMYLRAAAKNVQYRFTIDHITHEFVIGDGSRILQIIQNLISNGIKFTDENGSVEANVSERLLDGNQIEFIFTCRDTGKGMSEEFLKKVCAPFNQSDRSYSRTYGGLGLGLYLTKYFVDAMHGTLEVESKLGRGSQFVVKIPLKRPGSAQIMEKHMDCSHVRAIVAGANQEENNQIKEFLKRLKMKCDMVADADKLVKRILSRTGGAYEYALCIIDETLLTQDCSLIDQVASLEHAPTIFTLLADSRRLEELKRKEQVNQALYKPLFQSVLFDAVINTFGEYEVEDENTEREDFTGLHVMVVEDNEVNADIIGRILRKVNVELTICENGKVAVDTFEQAQEGTYGMIFMDIQMPVMDGYEATTAIRHSKKAEGATIPIVAVSANAFARDIELSMQSGMNEHLSKPVHAKLLYEVIKKYCYQEV